jgi:hypothetical protein
MKKQLNQLFFFIFFSSIFLFAQEEEKKEAVFGWQNQMVGNLNFTQNAFSENWGQGGEDSWSWALNINAKFENDQEKFNWANSGRLAYGQASISGQDPRKAADEIKLESVYTYKFGTFINPYFAATTQTQFTKGFHYSDSGKTASSNFFDPGYISESFGIGYKPNNIIKTRLGAAAKQTITDKYADIYAGGDKFRNEIGAESVTDLNYKINEQIIYESKLELFTNFKGADEIDTNWDNTFSATVTEYIKVSFNFRLVYDKDVSEKRQLKQTLAVGLAYTFL